MLARFLTALVLASAVPAAHSQVKLWAASASQAKAGLDSHAPFSHWSSFTPGEFGSEPARIHW